jgi:galactose oxidase-like protein
MRAPRLFVTLSAALLLAAIASASPAEAASRLRWTLQGPLTPPSLRTFAAMAFDSGHGQVVLFGGMGADGSNPLGDTWTWSGGQWTLRTPGVAPSPRFGAAMAYDEARQQIVLFGGFDGSMYLADTWTWDGTTWTQQSPASSPSVRLYAAAAYDPVRQVIVLFGGDGGHFLGDTWTWNGTTWSKKSPATTPSPRYGASMAFDAGHGVAVLFGGGAPAVLFDETWTWDGSTWTQQHPSASPLKRVSATMDYDARLGVNVLFGGRGQSHGSLDSTWTWDGASWTPSGAPGRRPAGGGGLSMAYDDADQETILLSNGGFPASTQTWTLGPP